MFRVHCKKIIYIFLFTCLIISCSKNIKSDWLLLIYADESGNLSDFVSSDLNEIKLGLNQINKSNKNTNRIEVLSYTVQKDGTPVIYEINETGINKIEWENNQVDILYKRKSFEKFISITTKSYKANHTGFVILGHGEGPLNSNKYSIQSHEISNVLKLNGYNKNKIDILILDKCLGSSIEEVFEFSDCCRYMLASPINIPRDGLNYKKVISRLSEKQNPKDAGISIISDFMEYQQIGNNTWSIKASASKYSMEEISFHFFSDVSALTMIDLRKISNVLNSINLLATSIIELPKKDQKELMDFCFKPKTPLWCSSSYLDLYDLGYLSDKIIEYDKYNSKKLKIVASKLQNNLSELIVCAWRDGSSDDNSLYYKTKYSINNSINSILCGDYYGITISGGIKTHFDKKKVSELYKTELNFGEESQWSQILLYDFAQ